MLAAAVLAAACVVWVAVPFLREPAAANDALDDLDEDQRRLLELAEARDRALAALKELEFDHRTGRIAEDDYRAAVGALRAEAAAALRELERARGQRPPRGTARSFPQRTRIR